MFGSRSPSHTSTHMEVVFIYTLSLKRYHPANTIDFFKWNFHKVLRSEPKVSDSEPSPTQAGRAVTDCVVTALPAVLNSHYTVTVQSG